MQTQSSKLTFWNKLVIWVEALESTSFDYHQDQLGILRSEISELNGRVNTIESERITKQEPSQVF